MSFLKGKYILFEPFMTFWFQNIADVYNVIHLESCEYTRTLKMWILKYFSTFTDKITSVYIKWYCYKYLWRFFNWFQKWPAHDSREKDLFWIQSVCCSCDLHSHNITIVHLLDRLWYIYALVTFETSTFFLFFFFEKIWAILKNWVWRMSKLTIFTTYIFFETKRKNRAAKGSYWFYFICFFFDNERND